MIIPNQLLFRLKSCVEYGLLNQNNSGFQNASGGLKNRLQSCLLDILNHGLKQNFNWNSPSPLLSQLRKIYGRFHPEVSSAGLDKRIPSVGEWLNLCLLEQCLADHFKLLLAGKTVLQNLYTAEGFLLSVSYSDGMMLCLQALELKRPELLAEIDPILFLSKHPYNQQGSISTPVLSQQTSDFHRSTFSVVSLGIMKETSENVVAGFDGLVGEPSSADKCDFCSNFLYQVNCCSCISAALGEILDRVCDIVVTQNSEEKRPSENQATNQLKKQHRRTISDFVLDKSTKNHRPSTPERVRGNYERSLNPNCEDLDRVDEHVWNPSKKVKRRLAPLSLKRSDTWRPEMAGRSFTPTEKDFDWLRKSLEYTQKSLMEARLRDLEVSIELERENTHFYLSEMLIAAVEQMKWRQMMGEVFSWPSVSTAFDSCNGNRQAERIVSSQNQNCPEMQRNFYSTPNGFGPSSVKDEPGWAGSNVDLRSEAADSEYPFSEVSLSELNDRDIAPSTSYDNESVDDSSKPSTSFSSYDIRQSEETTNGRSPYSIGYSMSPPSSFVRPSTSTSFRQDSASVSSAALWPSMETINSEETVDLMNPKEIRSISSIETERALSSTSSAEAVAASLLRHFSRKIRPTASEMDWMVSYRDAPQLILPLPTSSPVAPDEFYEEYKGSEGTSSQKKVRLRGTHDWAPPRPQVIFSLHPPPKLKALLEAQHYRCAGCGLKLEKSVYQKRVRYCEYLGRFFCQVCHRGSYMLIPARILHRWDFRLFPVSDFGQRFLSEHANTPMFNVGAVNRKLYDQVRSLRVVRDKRQQTLQMWDYVRTCRVGNKVVTKEGKLKDLFLALPRHFLEDLEMYALSDFSRVKDGTLEKLLDRAIYFGKAHIEGCEHCKAQGFLCELCKKPEVLFPYQVDNVYQCKMCGSCSHLKCCKRNKFVCPKCMRIKERKRNEMALAALARAKEPSVEMGVEEGDEVEEAGVSLTEIDYSAPVVLY